MVLTVPCLICVPTLEYSSKYLTSVLLLKPHGRRGALRVGASVSSAGIRCAELVTSSFLVEPAKMNGVVHSKPRVCRCECKCECRAISYECFYVPIAGHGRYAVAGCVWALSFSLLLCWWTSSLQLSPIPSQGQSYPPHRQLA